MLGKADSTSQAVIKRPRRSRKEEVHGGAWKVAFADFSLALLCLFLVMWLMAVRQQQHLQDLLRTAGGSLIDEGRGRMSESIGGPRGSLIAREPLTGGGELRMSRRLYESRADLTELGEILSRMSEQEGLSANLRWVVTPYGLRVMLHDTEKVGMFRRGSAVPTEPFRRLLESLGPLFSRVENQLVIVGHTDSVQYVDRGPDAMSNWALSSARALAARRHLLIGGMPESSVLQVVGLADVAPLNSADTTAHENRRIELLVLTRAQAKEISAMFGMPEATRPLIEGAGSSVPSRAELTMLRDSLQGSGL
ncbi:MAG: flagellar motor protein MotB [Pseudomonadota bacterium]|nr:MAG: histidine kinase [Pseudomonadota bacterium]